MPVKQRHVTRAVILKSQAVRIPGFSFNMYLINGLKCVKIT